MRAAHCYRASLFALVLSGIVPTTARALLTFDDGRDQLFVTADSSVSYDSNIFANRFAQSDTIYSGGVGLQYLRHAGIISVDASAGISTSRFDKFSSEDFSDPHFQGEFSAKDERTAADLTLSTSRQNEPDITSGVRAVSWNYAAGFDAKYNVTDRYSISGNLGYTAQDFVNSPSLVDLKSYSVGADLFYTINSARDFFTGYSLSVQQTSRDLTFYDHSFTFGIDGKILPKLNGTVRVGYQLQEPHGSTASSDYTSTGALTEGITLTWNLSRRTKITGDVSQNFTTTATNGSVNSLTGNLAAQFAANAKLTLSGGVGGGYNRFIGAVADGRRDTYFDWNAGMDYSFNEHFKVSLDYTHYENWSTLSFSDFIRNTWTLTLNVRF